MTDKIDDFLLNDEKGKNFKLDDFVVPVIGFALSNVKGKVEIIINHSWVNDYKLYINNVSTTW